MDTKNYLKCTDCAHAVNSPSTTLARWFNAQHGWQCKLAVLPGTVSIVTGQKTPDVYDYCSVERGTHGACGPGAGKWLPIRKRDLFKLLARKEA